MVALLWLYRGKTATDRWSNGGILVAKWWDFEVFLADFGKKTVVFMLKMLVYCENYGGGDER